MTGSSDVTSPTNDAEEVECAAALDGSLDACGPMQSDNVMKKHNVAQSCQQRMEYLRAVSDKSKVHLLKQEEAMTVAEAVAGMAKLHHGDTLRKLLECAAREL